jgi:hypothetical protein
MHKQANEFFSLLGSNLENEDLTSLLEKEWNERCTVLLDDTVRSHAC